jgi:hypothetical protein
MHSKKTRFPSDFESTDGEKRHGAQAGPLRRAEAREQVRLWKTIDLGGGLSAWEEMNPKP